jgi:hypothetical protein
MEFLHEGETIILKDDAKSDYFGKGTLYLTNARIVFEAMTGGLFAKTSEIKIDQPMSSIKEVSVPTKKTLRIQFEGNVEPTELFVHDAEKWEAAVKSALIISGKM